MKKTIHEKLNKLTRNELFEVYKKLNIDTITNIKKSQLIKQLLTKKGAGENPFPTTNNGIARIFLDRINNLRLTVEERANLENEPGGSFAWLMHILRNISNRRMLLNEDVIYYLNILYNELLDINNFAIRQKYLFRTTLEIVDFYLFNHPDNTLFQTLEDRRKQFKFMTQKLLVRLNYGNRIVCLNNINDERCLIQIPNNAQTRTINDNNENKVKNFGEGEIQINFGDHIYINERTGITLFGASFNYRNKIYSAIAKFSPISDNNTQDDIMNEINSTYDVSLMGVSPVIFSVFRAFWNDTDYIVYITFKYNLSFNDYLTRNNNEISTDNMNFIEDRLTSSFTKLININYICYDLKPENTVIWYENDEILDVKMIDWDAGYCINRNDDIVDRIIVPLRDALNRVVTYNDVQRWLLLIYKLVYSNNTYGRYGLKFFKQDILNITNASSADNYEPIIFILSMTDFWHMRFVMIFYIMSLNNRRMFPDLLRQFPNIGNVEIPDDDAESFVRTLFRDLHRIYSN
jgi:hypothetical protein